ncbi:MAG: mercuric transporter MerT family protein [Gemmatimonadales bacterium]
MNSGTTTSGPGGALREAGAVGASVSGMGGALTTIVASACCASPALAPLFVGVLGASGAAWAAGLKPYRGYILLGSLCLLMVSFWSVYRRQPTCPVGVVPPKPHWSARAAKVVVWIGALLWCAALVVDLSM